MYHSLAAADTFAPRSLLSWPDTRPATFRPDPRYYEPVETVAAEAGVSMNVLLQAMLREFLANPTTRLAALAPHLGAVAAETPRRGRPSGKTCADLE